MRNIKFYLLNLVLAPVFLWAGVNPNSVKSTHNQTNSNYRTDCVASRSESELNINNVRARLRGGGDLWWDGQNAKYGVPKQDPASGIREVNSLFAGAIWLGGVDPGGNLKVAAQTYRNNGNDFWTGPINPTTGDVTRDECSSWDKHFEVLGSDIRSFNGDWSDGNLTSSVPDGIKYWPARGNDNVSQLYADIIMPDQDLAPFQDFGPGRDPIPNGVYDPEVDGDYPAFRIERCGDKVFADQMIWWVYNDAGNVHSQSGGDPIRMEIQSLAFSYQTNDPINDMTFYYFKLINRAFEDIDEMYFSVWIDPDLGNPEDDFIGVDSSRSLGYVYNSDNNDQDLSGIPGYGTEIPMLGVDYFRGPKGNDIFDIICDTLIGGQGDTVVLCDTLFELLPASSFMYYLRSDFAPNPAMADPQVAEDFYNYQQAKWRDGSSLTFGGNGYDGSIPTNFAFTGFPDVSSSWNMAVAGLGAADFRFLHSTGPLVLKPGRTNEMIFGVTWVPKVGGGAISIDRLLEADDYAQSLFDACFDIFDGPPAPNLEITELDQEVLININPYYNGESLLDYEELDPRISKSFPDTTYVFEGFIVYQLADADVTTAEYADPDRARPIFVVDKKNSVTNLINWSVESGIGATPQVMTVGDNSGIKTSLSINTDAFASGSSKLVNHKKYYFSAVSYAYNNYKDFNPSDLSGQRMPHAVGRLNIKTYTAIPHINNPEFSGLNLNSYYGEGIVVTKTDGEGNGGNFLRITEKTTNEILANNTVTEVEYMPNSSPIDVKIINPLLITDGSYRLHHVDRSDSLTSKNDMWVLTDVNTQEKFYSEFSLTEPYEQTIPDRGISIKIDDVVNVGEDYESDITNGYLGEEVTNASAPWLTFMPSGSGIEEYLRPEIVGGEKLDADPFNAIRGSGNYWMPIALVDNDDNTDPDEPDDNQIEIVTPGFATGNNAPFIHPNSVSAIVGKLSELNNVDIVITPDKSKWSRCVVVNTYNYMFQRTIGSNPYDEEPYQIRSSASLDKNGQRANPANGASSNPDDPNYLSSTGMSWFPGYAIDVETGRRLNIFFGENSWYNGTFGFPNIGADMVWNPSSQKTVSFGQGFGYVNYFVGGQHYVYVTNETYDGFASYASKLYNNNTSKTIFESVNWCTVPLTIPGTTLSSMADGLVPGEVSFSVRVNKEFKNKYISSDPYNFLETNNKFPDYKFEISGKSPLTNDNEIAVNALDLIRAVPNPYYAFSSYEQEDNNQVVKITNLPDKCNVTIYSIDGKFIRKYTRAEVYGNSVGNRSSQTITSLDWDLRNSKGIQVASGVYLIHIEAPGIGEKTIKWFGVQRPYDTQGL